MGHLSGYAICAAAEMSRDEIERHANWRHPAGVGLWQISDEDFATGEANPCPCNHDPQRLHYLLNC